MGRAVATVAVDGLGGTVGSAINACAIQMN